MRSVIRIVSRVSRVAPRRVALLAAGASITAAAATTTTTTPTGTTSTTNTRSRSVAHVTSPSTSAIAAVPKVVHWSADLDGINATQRELARTSSTDPVERLQHATTRALLQTACEAPGVVAAKLSSERVATATSPTLTSFSVEESAFLQNMEKQFGSEVLPILRRQEWSIHLAPTVTAGTPSTTSPAATLVCYFQEGTQRILFQRISLA